MPKRLEKEVQACLHQDELPTTNVLAASQPALSSPREVISERTKGRVSRA